MAERFAEIAVHCLFFCNYLCRRKSMLTDKSFLWLRRGLVRLLILGLMVAVCAAQSALAGAQKQTPTHGKRPARLVIRGAIIVDGNGTPASGPKDIVIEGNTIT